uniref:Pre-rRNA-processing protein TSR2 homolog n=1 Tax=Glossina austeni TaxID=7395 RepID=A0A1A9V649_GLOAU
MSHAEFHKNFRLIVEKIFNNWQNLRLAVEHGMGGRNGQQVAIEIVDYIYKYCIGNENISEGELQQVLEELMDEEFNTICEDGSVIEICQNLLRYKQMSLRGQYKEIESELTKLPSDKEWLNPNVKITYASADVDSSSEDEADNTGDDDDTDDMEVDLEDKTDSVFDCPSSSQCIIQSHIRQKEEFIEPDPGWTTVRRKKK